MSELAAKRCEPCSASTPPLKGQALQALRDQLGGHWQVIQEHHLEKEVKFPDFKSALAYTNRVGELAEQENHHPDIYLSWGKVKITLWTHSINGLSGSDFILAAKIDQL